MTSWGIASELNTQQYLETRTAFTSVNRSQDPPTAGNQIVLGAAFFNGSSDPTSMQQVLNLTLAQYEVVTLVHEVLHSATGKDDIKLAAALGLGDFTDAATASNAITKLLANNCGFPKP